VLADQLVARGAQDGPQDERDRHCGGGDRRAALSDQLGVAAERVDVGLAMDRLESELERCWSSRSSLSWTTPPRRTHRRRPGRHAA
jgi:hypothetical protein